MDLSWFSFAMFAGALIITSGLHLLFLRRLRREFPELWRDMNSPTGWSDGSMIEAFGTYRYLWDRRYEKFAPSAAFNFCESFRGPMICTYVATWLSMIFLLVATLLDYWP